MERIYRRKTPAKVIVTDELAATLTKISKETGRQVGVLIDRRGRIAHVIVGDQSEIVIPNLSRVRTGAGRLKGLRLVHTHLKNEPLSKDDLNDLALLRLDLVMAIGVGGKGEPLTVYIAHLDPDRDATSSWKLVEPLPFSRLNFQFDEFIGGLEDDLSRLDTRKEEKDSLTAVLVHLSNFPKKEAEARLDELSELARTEKIRVAERTIYKGVQNPKNLIGSGRMKDLVIRSYAQGADMILFDQELTPAQAKWIGNLTEMPILDRTQLILRIFARRAFSSDGRLRVELARLKYLLPRIGTRDDALSRIRGGIGMRGPGETAMEVSRRRIKERISRLNKQLEKLGHGREQRRSRRKRAGIPQVAVIGYTNAGKSSLLNAITKSAVLVEDKLFATLDPTARRVRFPKEMEVVFLDTVGFIGDLPEDLLDAFRSTLEELADADLLLHLVDISAPDFERMIEAVEGILRSLDLDKIPRRVVVNKIDKVEPQLVKNIAERYDAIAISALKGTGLADLTGKIVDELTRLYAEERPARFPEH